MNNKVAVATDSSSGNGRAIALACIREGAKVFCADITPSPRYEINHEIRSTALKILQQEGSKDRLIAIVVDGSIGKDVQALVDKDCQTLRTIRHVGRAAYGIFRSPYESYNSLHNRIMNNAVIAPPPSMKHETPENE